MLVAQVVPRLLFPWDLFLWSESPFMTNMLKLSAGRGVYSAPADASSFVYSPGLEWLSFGLLRPLGLHLDVRACRFLVTALALWAAVAGALAGRNLLEGGRRSRLCFCAFAALAILLVHGRNYTFDVCHPDNLHVAHTMSCFLLLLWALGSAKLWPALVVVGVAGLGALAKQTGAFTVIGVVAALFALRPDLRCWRHAAAVIAVMGISTGLVAAVLLGPPDARFWTASLLREHPVDFFRVRYLLGIAVTDVPHRAILLAAAPACLMWLLQRPDDASRRFAVAWTAIFVFGAAPALASYLKAMGMDNNFGGADVMAATLVLPVAWRLGESAPRGLAALPLGALLLLLCTLLPTRMPPTAGHRAYGLALDAAVLEGARRGQSVLLSHGTMPLIRAGLREPPSDRSNSILELNIGKQGHRAGTIARIQSKHYGRIILVAGHWYGDDVLRAIAAHYREVQVIPSALGHARSTGREGYDYYFGYQPDLLIHDVKVMEPK